MIRSFGDQATADIFDGLNSKSARRVPRELHSRAERLLDLLNGAAMISDLRIPPSNRLETLKGDLKGFYSIRINQQWRIIFQWQAGDALNVKIIDYH